MEVEFEWDPDKARTNLKKHGVRFEEASTVFGDVLAITVSDPDHSRGEERYLTFGRSEEERLLAVAHCETEETIRIISARAMTSKERKYYEQGETG